MKTPNKCYVAEAIYSASVPTEGDVRSSVKERLLFLVEAGDPASARSAAEAVGRGKDHLYRNEQGQLVNWTFVQLVDVTEMIDQHFETGAELKSVLTDDDLV